MDFRTMLKKKKYAKNVNDEGDPDWGKLKKVPGEGGSDSDPDKQVNNPLFLRLYLIFNIILYKCIIIFRWKVREIAESGIYTLSFFDTRQISPKIARENGDSKKLVKP